MTVWLEIKSTFQKVLKSYQSLPIDNLRVRTKCRLQFDVMNNDDLIASFDDEDEVRSFLKELEKLKELKP